MKTNLIIFLAIFSISCSSNSSNEAINDNSNIFPTNTSEPIETSKPVIKDNNERKILPTEKPTIENKQKTTFYPTVVPTKIPTITPTITPTPNSKENAIIFENLEFESYIREKINKTSTYFDPYITLEDISNIKEIKIGDHFVDTDLNNKISMENLRDLKYFKNLEKLTIREAGIIDIDGIEELHNLEYLDLSYNNIENIEKISLLRNLEHLYLYDNKISDIWAFTPQKNPYLKHLWLDGNNISTVAPFVTSLNEFSKQLTHVGLGRNPIVSKNWNQVFSKNIRTFQLQGLDIDNKILQELLSQEHGFPNLGHINLLGNKKITDLTPLLELEGLEQIYLDEKVHGSALDVLMRDDGANKLIENGVNVKYSSWGY
ncbi:MAG: hypothetical protein CL773_00795 [Chloroflexi bacterium]|nr:hypothetical protein [Chloroflexota bacterium]